MPLVLGKSCASMFWIRIVASCVTALAAQDPRQRQTRVKVSRPSGRRGEKPSTGKDVARMASGNRKRASLCATATCASTKGKVAQVTGCRALRNHMQTIAAISTKVMAKKICAGNK